MTYIELINEFWKLNAIKPFGVTDTAVYLYLLQQCNIQRWQNPFEVSTKIMECTLGISRKAIIESRNRLKRRGLIDFTEGSRYTSPIYTLTALSESDGPTHYAGSNPEDKDGNNTNKTVEVKADDKTDGNAEVNADSNAIGNVDGNIQGNVNGNTYKNKTKTKEKDLLEKLSVESKKKALTPFEMIGEYRRTSGNPGYLKFLDWLEASAPYVSHHIKPLSEDEFERLRAQFGSRAITVNIHNIENRKDLRKKYASLYRTLINWCKKD